MDGSSLTNPGDTLYLQYAPGNDLNTKEGVLQQADPLSLEIEDGRLADIADDRLDKSEKFFKKQYNLFERRAKNEVYIFGKQISEAESKNDLKKYESRFMDNALYEIAASQKPLAMSRLPDLIVTPAQEGNDEQIQIAQDVTKVINNQIKSRENRIALGIAFKHRPVYFTGIIKCVWVPKINNFVFKAVHPSLIEVDHTAQSNDADDMQFVAETLPITVQEVLLRFPSKKQEFIQELGKDGIKPGPDGELKQKDLASEIKIKEIWFSWLTDIKKENGEVVFEEQNAVMWKYHRCILKKMKNPTWDWEGQEDYFIYDNPEDPESKRKATPEDLMGSLMTMLPPSLKKETTYKNYFENPRKPYFFMGYDQWRKMPYDETSELEQNIRSQESLDKAGKRIIEKMDQRPKHVWSKDGGVTGKIIQSMDMNDPNQDMLVEKDVRSVHAVIPPEPVSPAEIEFMKERRERMYAVAGVDAVQGDLQTDVATSNQIAREANYTRMDDVVEDTINAACEWIAQWSLQMVKLRYTDYHFVKRLGAEGKVTFLKLRSDMIDQGMDIIIKSSGTDKIMARNQANDMAKLGIIDPLSYFEDIGVSDPEGRLQRLMLFKTNPMEYMTKYVLQKQGDLQMLTQMLNGVPPQQPMQPGPMGAPPMPGAPPVNPSMGNPQAAPPVTPQASPSNL